MKRLLRLLTTATRHAAPGASAQGDASGVGAQGDAGGASAGVGPALVGVGGMRLPVLRLVGAGALGAATEAAGLCLMATATWLLVTAAGQPPITALTVAIVSVRALAIARGGLRYLERLASHDAVLRIVTQVRARIFATLVDRPPARHADALSRMVSDVDAVQDLVVRVALPLASCGLVALLAVIVTSVFAPAAGLTLLAGLVLTIGVIPVLGARLVRQGAAQLAPLRAAYAISTVDLVHGAADLAAYGATARFEEAGAKQASELSTLERGLARRAFALDAISSIVTGLTAAAMLVVCTGQSISPVWTSVLTVGALATGEVALGILAATRKGAEIVAPLRRVGELITPAQAEEQVAAEPFTQIKLSGVSVAGRLEDIDLVIEPGSRIAVIGASGAGKSTLLSVIAGAIGPDSGTVSGNGPAYSVATGLMADAHIFHATVRDNLLLGRPSATDAEVLAAAHVAGLGDFLSRYQENAGEDGGELSGGQRQRVALARAVLAAPPVLLLNEPTEGLDPAQADSVLEAVFAHAGESAVVLVTHRLAGLERLGFDEIIVMDEGRIVSRRPTH